ncbi:unnamed protein product [Schistosoma curassoni]|uniref:UDENN domain-containing protein n=1 Tax=Schistosoma curassoni TaxID=6186 RepID=A0A183K859_9TREM|nr:unnamed protein product [Schistosoma curassoni]
MKLYFRVLCSEFQHLNPHIICLLLERSLLFCSRRLTKLTACVLTSVSLLYPIQW